MKQTIILKDVFEITETRDPRGRSRFTKIGIGFENRDGSINVVLDTYRDEHGKEQFRFPRDGRMQIRDRAPNKES